MQKIDGIKQGKWYKNMFFLQELSGTSYSRNPLNGYSQNICGYLYF